MGFSVVTRQILVEATPHGVKMLGFVSDVTHPAWMKNAINKAKGKRLVHADDIVSLAEVSRRLDTARTTVHGWSQHESFPPSIGKVGKSDMYLWSEIRRWYKWVPKDEEGHLKISYGERKEKARKEKNRDKRITLRQESGEGTEGGDRQAEGRSGKEGS